MARKKDQQSLGCLLIIIVLFVLSWVFSNFIGVIGIILIATALYFRQYKRQINSIVFWIIFLVGVITTTVWFT